MRDPTAQDTEGLLPKQDWLEAESTQSTRRATLKNWQKYSLAILTVLGITNIITFGAVVFLLSSRQSHTACVNQPPQGVAPSLAHLAGKPRPEVLNVSFYPDGTPWREHNSTEADEVWAEYTQADGGFIMIPKEEAAEADIDPARHAYVDRPDLGMVGYPVLPEAVHQMHCVNMLRRNLYYNKEHTRSTCRPPFCVPPELEDWDILHIDHCLEIIRRRIACTADLGIVPFLWYHNSGKLTGENVRMHTCGNYDVIKQFVAEKGVKAPPLGTQGALKPPEGAYTLKDYDQ
ncbi:hypothetical protein O1611_g2040 [Lasiodiplodia mahajangana]|uniref:Uncharacterized protein n=1 Tax=Lasiodiplodia mahajangana TaxID=1108764 RepID=A0ACC2JVN0_9PEZI|nr:hypothetical protein O1611_g2040 [Lasiodiplodia mahajangana]